MSAELRPRRRKHPHNQNVDLPARRDAPVTCASCGRQVPRRARQQRFCSARCQEKARYAR
jgi:hypothetical protein